MSDKTKKKRKNTRKSGAVITDKLDNIEEKVAREEGLTEEIEKLHLPEISKPADGEVLSAESVEEAYNEIVEAARENYQEMHPEEVVAEVAEEVTEAVQEAAETVTEKVSAAVEKTDEAVEEGAEIIAEEAGEIGEQLEEMPEYPEEETVEFYEEENPDLEVVPSEPALVETVEEAAEDSVTEQESIHEEAAEAVQETAEPAVEEVRLPFEELGGIKKEEVAVEPQPEADLQQTMVYSTEEIAKADDLGATKELKTEEISAISRTAALERTTHMQVKKKRVKKRPQKLGFNWFFWISFVIILVPFIYFGSLLLSAQQETGTPIMGDRSRHDIQFAISDNHINSLTQDLKGIEGVKNVSITLRAETLRIILDCDSTLDAEALQNINVAAYNKVNETLPVENYFTQKGDYKQYDLEIFAQNTTADGDIIVCLNKNSNMEKYNNQVLTTPVNPDLVEELINKDGQNNNDDDKSGDNEGIGDEE